MNLRNSLHSTEFLPLFPLWASPRSIEAHLVGRKHQRPLGFLPKTGLEYAESGVCALHTADPGYVPDTPYSPRFPPGVNLKCRARARPKTATCIGTDFQYPSLAPLQTPPTFPPGTRRGCEWRRRSVTGELAWGKEWNQQGVPIPENLE